MSAALAAVLAIIGALVVAALSAIVGEEAKGWCPHLARWLVRAAVRICIPADEQPRYLYDWLVDVSRYDSRPMTAIVWSIGCFPAAVSEGRALRHASRTRDAQPPDVASDAAAPAVALPPIRQVDLLGISLADTSYEEVLEWIDAAVAGNAREYICTARSHTLTSCQSDLNLQVAMKGAAFTIPTSRFFGWGRTPSGDRVRPLNGPELMARATQSAAKSGQRFYLYGGRDQSALFNLTLRLRQRFPGLRVVGGYAPPFRQLGTKEIEQIAAQINRARPDVVWVGIGVPRQEHWMAQIRPLLDAPVLVGIGGAFDFHAGLLAPTPAWAETFHLSWAFEKFANSPWRRWPRIVRVYLLVAWALFRERVLKRHASGRVEMP